MSVYSQSIEYGKRLNPAEDVRRETDHVRAVFRSELAPIAEDIIKETIIPKIEEAVNKGQYSCDVDLPNYFDYQNKYGKEIDRQNMSFVHDLIVDYLTALRYKVLILNNAYDAYSTLAIRVIWCAIKDDENYSS